MVNKKKINCILAICKCLIKKLHFLQNSSANTNTLYVSTFENTSSDVEWRQMTYKATSIPCMYLYIFYTWYSCNWKRKVMWGLNLVCVTPRMLHLVVTLRWKLIRVDRTLWDRIINAFLSGKESMSR